MWGRGNASFPFLSGNLGFPAIQMEPLVFPSIRALPCRSSPGEHGSEWPPCPRSEGVSEASAARGGERSRALAEPPGRAGAAPGAATPDTARRFRGCQRHSRLSQPAASFPRFFSEPDGDAFGFSFKHVTFVRRIKRAGTALGRSGTRQPGSARGNHIKARGCASGGRAQRAMMPGASCTRSCDL